MKIITSVIDGNGKTLHIGSELGHGGEGSVFEVQGHPNIVAKLYHNALDLTKQQKISAMVACKSDQISRFATWPISTVKTSNNGNIIGLLMPKLSGKEIHKLYGPKTRLLEFPNATFSFLIHTAANLARAFAAVHESGHVIGDVNHGNFYVTDKATVMLVDCDSFQITTSNAQYRCEVGVPMYQPPELQDITSFRDIIRTSNHDNFGLAVFIFLLLFMGRHPYSGRFLGPGDVPIEKAIKEFRFAYSSAAATKMMQPPPATLNLNSMPPALADMFESAFSLEGIKEGRRPTAKEWIQALEAFSNQTKKCPRNEGHIYLNTLLNCPWCELESKTGVVLFQAVLSSAYQGSITFKLEIVWAQIKGVPSPGVIHSFPNISSYTMQPSPKAVEFKRDRRKRIVYSIIPVIAGFSAILAMPAGAFWIVIITSIIIYVVYNSQGHKIKSELKENNNNAKKQWKSISERWKREVGEDPFIKKMNELEKARNEYLDLSNQRRSKLSQLESQQRNRQSHVFLQSFRLDDAKIAGIGPSRKATLESYGIETAADINIHAIQQVPGFGPSYTRKLIAWRDSVQRKFVYDPSKGVPQSDIIALDRDIRAKRTKLEQELLNGATQLMHVSNQVKVRRNSLWVEVEESAKAVAQAEADMKMV